MSEARRIAVAMSGGVDSSVAAALLVEQGEDVFGLMLRLWSEAPDRTNRCCSPGDMDRARRIAGQLDFPFYALDVRQPFKRQVVDFFIDGYAHGLTPNPCMRCNRHIRWEFLLHRALAMGATHLATGHYARVQRRNGGHALLRAEDRNKDQSYVLSVLGQEQLRHALFPLGMLTKTQVRQHARRLLLPVADRDESQDLCFVGRSDYRDFLRRQGADLPPPGPIVDADGAVIGQHSGLANYTIGQRKGIGISASEPLYVLHKEVRSNQLVVGPRRALGRTQFDVDDVHWISGAPPPTDRELLVRVRYQAPEVAARVEPATDRGWRVLLGEPLPDITPGQAAVFYDGQICLGGGIITP